jgi:F0F1-type ATP synthase membrane subunit c/vacuolar-type H+-ATPase subunit K
MSEIPQYRIRRSILAGSILLPLGIGLAAGTYVNEHSVPRHNAKVEACGEWIGQQAASKAISLGPDCSPFASKFSRETNTDAENSVYILPTAETFVDQNRATDLNGIGAGLAAGIGIVSLELLVGLAIGTTINRADEATARRLHHTFMEPKPEAS